MQNADGFFDDTFRFRYILTNVNNLPKEGHTFQVNQATV